MVRRRAEGDTTRVEVTPETVVEMLGAPKPDADLAGRTGSPGTVLGLYLTEGDGGDVSSVEASRMPGAGALTLTGRLGESMQESARTAMSWLRVNAGRYGFDPSFHRDTDVHLHVPTGSGRQKGTSAGVAMVAALVSVFTGRPVRGDLAMTEEIALSGEVIAVGGVKEKVLAAHRCGLTRVILPQQYRKQVEEDLGDDLRSAVAVDYVTRIEDLLELALRPAPAANDAAAVAATDGRVS